jgi:cytochrome c oxidase subunit 4
MNPGHPTKKIFTCTWLVLVLMHFTILGSAYLDLKGFNTPFMIILAFIQMILVILFFMEVRYTARLVWLFVAAGFFWLGIMVTLTMSDYLTRNWH